MQDLKGKFVRGLYLFTYQVEGTCLESFQGLSGRWLHRIQLKQPIVIWTGEYIHTALIEEDQILFTGE